MASSTTQDVRKDAHRLKPFRTQLHRIRVRTFRTESLDRSNAKDLAQVVQNPSQCEGFGMWALLIMSKGFYIEHLEMDFQHF